MRKVVVVLEGLELLELKRILIDDDKEAALRFLKRKFEREMLSCMSGFPDTAVSPSNSPSTYALKLFPS